MTPPELGDVAEHTEAIAGPEEERASARRKRGSIEVQGTRQTATHQQVAVSPRAPSLVVALCDQPRCASPICDAPFHSFRVHSWSSGLIAPENLPIFSSQKFSALCRAIRSSLMATKGRLLPSIRPHHEPTHPTTAPPAQHGIPARPWPQPVSQTPCSNSSARTDG